MTEWIGRTLSKVKVEKVLGRGGMAEVYLGTHTTLKRPMAVKVLHAHLTEDEQVLDRFRAEAQEVAGLRHPNIVHVLDFDVVEGRPYIVMEFLEGSSLAEYLRGLHGLGHSLPLETIAHVIRSLCAALDYAHARGIVHRDVKPANVVLRSSTTPIQPGLPLPADAEPVLTDFGVARIHGAITRTASGTVLGTPAYMSPEQVRGEVVDGRSDVYSLGIILYEMLAGELPFNPETDTPASVLFKQISQPPPPLPNTSAAIQAVVDKALAKDRSSRYQRAGDLARELDEALRSPAAGEAAVQAPPGALPKTPAARPSRARILAWASVAAIALLLVGGGAALIRGALAPSEIPPSSPAAVSMPSETGESPATLTEAGPLAATAPAAAPGGLGFASFHDSDLEVVVVGIGDAPEGFAYHVWLTAADRPPLDLGRAETAAGTLRLEFRDPDAANLLGSSRGVEITLEPEPDPDPDVRETAIYGGIVDPEVWERIRLLEDLARGAPLSAEILTGMQMQVGHYSDHAGFAVNEVTGGNLAGAKSHAEHVMNILQGRAGELFGDWNGDGLAVNPGDDFGLLPYAQLLLDLVASESTREDLSPDPELRGLLDGLVIACEDAVQAARQIAGGDTIDRVRPIADQLAQLNLEGMVSEVLAHIDPLTLSLHVPIRNLGP